MNRIEIRNAMEKDLDRIVEISARNTIDKVDDTAAGFLVSGYTKKEYLHYLDTADHFYVATIDNEIVGVLLAFDQEKIRENEIVNNIIKYAVTRDFILIKQIFVDPKYKGCGVSAKLYEYLFETTPDTVSFAAVIVDKPFNFASVKFHQKMGFEKIMDVLPDEDYDGEVRERGVWYKKSRSDRNVSLETLLRIKVNDTSETKNVLLTNLQNATGLYTHEDTLNWTKLGMLVTFVFALCAAFSHYYEKSDTVSSILASIVVLLGFAISFLFDKKIHSGLMYMKSHKENIKSIENKLRYFCPHYERTIAVKNEKISNNSATANIMNVVPYISYAIWVVLFILLLIKLKGIA